eukprot:TRINITY_DN1203_c0_g1_i4.p1 TRINITY_DN1203_c0_g1~~TRINITY_DN1203_c0_g1_i4.p1  ORF type:complete len:1021 (-),score=293.21 TRINITY_DN1203_c0_g1_i4:98-3160(-)
MNDNTGVGGHPNGANGAHHHSSGSSSSDAQSFLRKHFDELIQIGDEAKTCSADDTASIRKILFQLMTVNAKAQSFDKATSSVSFFGDQSAGKSRLLSAMFGMPVGFSQSGVGTRALVLYDVSPRANRLSVSVDGQTLPSVMHIATSLQARMDEIGKTSSKFAKDPVNVKISTPAHSFYMLAMDHPGITANDVGGNRAVINELNLQGFSRIVRPNSTDVAVIVIKTQEDVEKSAFLNFFRESKINLSRCWNRVVLVFAHGDSAVRLKHEQGDFNQCRSWADMEEVLFGPWKKALGVPPTVPTFLTAVDPSPTSTIFQNVQPNQRDDDEIRRRLHLYESRNNDADRNMCDMLDRVAMERNFKDSPAERNRFFDHVGVVKFASVVRQMQMKGFLTTLPSLIESIGVMHQEIRAENANAHAILKQIEGTGIEDLVTNFFIVFSMLSQSLLQGESLSEHGTTQFLAVPVKGSPAKVPPHSRPEPIFWPNPTKWHQYRLAKTRTMEEEIQIAQELQASVSPQQPLSFPFHCTLRHPDPIDDLEAELEEQWIARYGPTREPEATGAIRLRHLSRELVSRLFWIDPGYVTCADLGSKFAGTASISGRVETALNDVLAQTTKEVLQDRFTTYSAQRFASVVWDSVQTILDFMETMPQFSSLLRDETGPYSFRKDVRDVLYSRYYQGIFQLILNEVGNAAANVNSFIDSWGTLFYEAAAMLSHRDPAFIYDWVKGHPRNDAYSSIVKVPLGKDEQEAEADKGGGGIGGGIGGVLGSVASTISSLAGFTPAVTILGNFGKVIDASELMGGMVRDVVNVDPTKRLMNQLVDSDNFAAKEDASDLIMYVANLGDSAEQVPLREREDRTTAKELGHFNYVYLRNFRARILDFSRSLYQLFMRNHLGFLDPTRMQWSWDEVREKFYLMLDEYVDEQQQQPTTSASDDDDEDITVIDGGLVEEQAHPGGQRRSNVELLQARYEDVARLKYMKDQCEELDRWTKGLQGVMTELKPFEKKVYGVKEKLADELCKLVDF